MTESTFLKMFRLMKERFPSFAKQWELSWHEFGTIWEHELSENIERVFGAEPGPLWEEAIAGYTDFCTDALRSQIFFEKTGRYHASNYDEVAKDCYHSSEYMLKKYCPGQYFAHYVWPHHHRMLQRFRQLLKNMPDIETFYEVGVGCGLYSQKTLEELPNVMGCGFDISDYALQFARRVVDAHCLGPRYKTFNQNIIVMPIREKADLVISHEVLEHLEDPQALVDALYAAVRSQGWGYITAAINAAHTDHIYLYRSPEEVQNQIERAGWKIEDIQVESSYKEKPEHLRPTIAAYLVRKM